MQISHIEVTPTTLGLTAPYRSSDNVHEPLLTIDVIFVRIETRHGENAWGCAAFDPAIPAKPLE